MDQKSYEVKRLLPADIGGDSATDPGSKAEPKIPFYVPELDGTGDEVLGNRWPYVNGMTLEHRYYSDVIKSSLESSQQMQNHISKKMVEAVGEGISEYNHNLTVYVDRKLYGISKDASEEVQDFVTNDPDKDKAGVVLMHPRGSYDPELIYKLEEAFGSRVYTQVDTAVADALNNDPSFFEARPYHDVAESEVPAPIQDPLV